MTAQDGAHVVEDPATDPLVAELADDYARRFRARSRQRLWRHQRSDYRFRRTIRRHWGKALNKYLLTWMAVVDFARDFNEENGPAAQDRQDFLFEALLLLHTRTCRLARAVHHDLAGGYVDDALARCRTMHEVSVTAQVLTTFGREPGYTDLAERYLLHKVISVANDAEDFRLHRRALGFDPLDARQVTDVKTAREHLLKRFGRSYGGDYGWAVGLPTMKKDANFAGLVALTDTEHLRPYYRWACHQSHAGSLTTAFSRQEVAEGEILIVGPTTSGLMEPASWALRTLCWSTESLALGAPPPDKEGYINGDRLPWLVGIDRLLGDAEDAFEMGNDSEQQAVARNKLKIHSASR